MRVRVLRSVPASGLLGGSAVAAEPDQSRTGESLQQIYNSAYAQCMTSKGNGIVHGGYVYGY